MRQPLGEPIVVLEALGMQDEPSTTGIVEFPVRGREELNYFPKICPVVREIERPGYMGELGKVLGGSQELQVRESMPEWVQLQSHRLERFPNRPGADFEHVPWNRVSRQVVVANSDVLN